MGRLTVWKRIWRMFMLKNRSDNLRGGWHTEASLLKEGWTTRPSRIAVCDFQVSWNHYLYHWPFQPFSQLCWLREMIQHSKKWATARNLVEKSEVHGEDEWRVPVMREFENKKLDRQTCAQRVGFVTQDRWLMIYIRLQSSSFPSHTIPLNSCQFEGRHRWVHGVNY